MFIYSFASGIVQFSSVITYTIRNDLAIPQNITLTHDIENIMQKGQHEQEVARIWTLLNTCTLEGRI